MNHIPYPPNPILCQNFTHSTAIYHAPSQFPSYNYFTSPHNHVHLDRQTHQSNPSVARAEPNPFGSISATQHDQSKPHTQPQPQPQGSCISRPPLPFIERPNQVLRSVITPKRTGNVRSALGRQHRLCARCLEGPGWVCEVQGGLGRVADG